MAHARRNNGLTLVEILLSVTIVAVLATIVTVAAGSLRKQAQIKLTQSTLAVISSALQQYNEFWAAYPPQTAANLTVFADQQQAFAKALGWPTPGEVAFVPVTPAHVPAYIPSEVLYIRLYRTPACRKMIGGFTPTSETDARKKAALAALVFTPDITGAGNYVSWGAGAPASKPNKLSLYRFVDAWRTELRYEYASGNPYPLVTSAGPDKNFGTDDDIKSAGK